MINLRTLLKHRILIALSTVTLAIPFIPTNVQAVDACPSSPRLSAISTFTRVTTNAAGGHVGYYVMPARAAGSNYPTRLAVFDGEISKYAMSVPTAKFGSLASQNSLAKSVARFETYVNSDFFDFGTYMPYSAIVSKSTLVYSPPPGGGRVADNGASRVFTYATKTLNEATGYTLRSTLISRTQKATINGVNLKRIPANSIIAFTSKNSQAKIPVGSYAILIRNNDVTKIYANGSSARPTSGTLFQATGTAVPNLKKFTMSSRVTFSLQGTKFLTADTIRPTGYISFGNNKIDITAVNFTGSHSTGATFFDSNFSTSAQQTVGDASFAIDNSGAVSQVSKNSGVQILPNSSTKTRVFQVFGVQASLVSQLSVGQKVQFLNSFSSELKNTVISASGRGANLLTNGINVANCTGSATSFRPRVAIGWNASGHFWVATTTMGMDHNDGGYRVGGSTLRQMSDWLTQLGSTEAVAFDGGGSVTQLMSLGGEVKRFDIPTDPNDGHEAWVRDIPVGIAFAPAS